MTTTNSVFSGKGKLRWILCLLLLFFCFSSNVFAQNQDACGAEIYYQYIGGSIYRIYITYCKRITLVGPANSELIITDGSTTKTFNDTLCCNSCYTTGFASGQCNKCTGGSGCSFPYGFQIFTYYSDVDLSLFKGCNLTVSWTINSFLFPLITTGAAGDPFYISTTLNRCNGDHSSPQFQEPAIMFVNIGKVVNQYQSVTPAINNDSIYYHLAPPLMDANTPEYYKSGYSYNHPLIYEGSISDAKPKGFHYDPNSGELDFTPEKTDVSLMSLEADEYAKDKSGKWYLAGSTVRSNVIVCDTFSTTKNEPVFSAFGTLSGDTFTVCAGNMVSFKLKAYDQSNPDDSLTMSAVNETSGSLNYTNGTSASASFTWTPQNSDVSAKPYHVIITASDNVAPIVDMIQATVFIFVKDSIPNVVVTPIDSGCARYYFRGKAQSSGRLFYQWYINNTAVSNDTSFAYTFPRNGVYIINLHLSNVLGCAWDYYDTVKIKILPGVLASGGKEICEGTSTSLSANGGLKYTWKSSAGLAIDTGSNVSVSPKITTHYYVSGTDAKGCMAIDTAIVVVDTIGLRLNTDTTICAGQMAYVKANIINAKSFSWVNLNNGQMSDSAAVYFKLVSDTQYSFTVTDSFGCIKSVDGAIHPDSSSFHVSQRVSVCYGDSLQLHVSGGSDYTWYPEIGLYKGSSSPNPYVLPHFNQDYPVSFTDQYGCVIRDTVKVIVSSLYHVYIPSDTICEGESVQLKASGGKSYLWSPAYNISKANTATPVVHPDSTTTYYVTVCDTFCGCKLVDSVTVNVNAGVKVNAGTNKQICQGDSVSIGTTTTFGYAYSWLSSPPGYHSLMSLNTVHPSATVTYILLATNLKGCSGLDSVTISVLPVSKPQLSGTQIVCKGDTQVYLITSYNKSNSYTWKIYGGQILAMGKSTEIIVWDSIGQDSIILLQQLPNQCQDSTTLAIINTAYPSVRISVVAQICLGNPSSFVDSGSAAKKYQWIFGDGDSSTVKNPVHTYSSAGFYHINLLSSNSQCISTDSAIIQVFNLPVRSPIITHIGFRQYSFDNRDSVGITYKWNTGDGNSLDYSDISHTYNDTGIYNVVFNYGYSWGCPQFFDTTINVTDEPLPPPPVYKDTVFVAPNPFIDHISISFSHSNQESIQITIYDAIGKLVSQKNIDNQAPGSYSYTFHALQLSSGIYFLKYQGEGKTIIFKILKI